MPRERKNRERKGERKPFVVHNNFIKSVKLCKTLTCLWDFSIDSTGYDRTNPRLSNGQKSGR